jgi:ribose-phosphate pyrophosphokinase
MPITVISRHDVMKYGSIKIYAGTACPELAANVAQYVGVPLCEREVVTFPNDNLFVKLHTSVRGQELLIMLQTLRLDSAARINAVVPYMCYSRSDKKDQPRIPITARLVADMIEVAGADRYATLDLHAGQIQGFFSIPGDVLTAFHLLTDYLKTLQPEMNNPVVVTVDLGFAKKGRNFAEKLNTPLAFIEKRRVANDTKIQALTVIGEVKGRDVILTDDEVDTGGSIVQAVKLLKENGARNIFVSFVHPSLNLNAAERLSELPVELFITTDTIPIPREKADLFGKRLKVLSIAPLLGEVIIRCNEGRSVGEMFKE